ncbi:MAG: aminomethyl-transferring glycine dehydrogenase subunit GcvPB [Deltaproteobacteria bacterium]|nr:aminomethyl-transferring glycine dehydrogenase subunit GcvPB [Deltaproteobacteria bacterium]
MRLRRVGVSTNEPLLFEIEHCLDKKGVDTEGVKIDKKYLRTDEPHIPELDEVSVVRHYTRLSQWNYGVDTGMYPLGSCTMKYNPKFNEYAARLNGFSSIHPYTPEDLMQGVLRIIYEMERYLSEIGGFERVTLIPSAGAHGEYTGLMMVRKYHLDKGNPRKKVLIPDTAHGTNPASCTLNGYEVVQVKSSSAGYLTKEELLKHIDEDVAALMVTNPNTLGIFEKEIAEIAEILHSKDALLYCDGANMNSLIGIAKPGDMGVDVLQYNLHKSFSTPHGGGGPGSGPVGVSRRLVDYLPVPLVEKIGNKYVLVYDKPKSVGQVKAFYGNFGIIVRAYSYIRAMGAEGLKKATEYAVLNSNYIRKRLSNYYHLPYETPSMHECVFTDKKQNEKGITTMDIAKRLIDYGFHPPTIYFPLVVHGAIMIEPTESESKDSLDRFIDAMIAIARESEENPDIVKNTPTLSPILRADEVKAAKELKLKYEKNRCL